MKTTRRGKVWGSDGRRGAALLYAMILATVVAGLCIALLAMSSSTTRLRVDTQNDQRAFYAAEAGLSDAYMQMDAGRIVVPDNAPVYVGSAGNPVALGPSSYWVLIRKLDSRSYSLVSTGNDGRYQDRLELVLAEEPSGFFQYAAFGSDRVVLNSNSFIDSYDSSLGAYDSQVTAGNAFAREHGNVGSNGDILLGSNTSIHGDALPGPGHTVDDSRPNTYISGSTDPAESEFPMPPIDVPVIASSGSIRGSTVVTLGPGRIHYDTINLRGGSTLRIQGPATLVVDDFQMNSNTNLIFDATGGEIELYGTGNFVLESNSTVTTLSDSALGVTLLLDGDNMGPGGTDRVSIAANSDFIGAIYAPNAQFRLASNFDVFGSIICKYLDLSSYGEIHFDEALLYDGWGSTDEYAPALWHKLPRE